MRPIATMFTEKGFTYTQLMRSGQVALYAQYGRYGSTHYEVVIIHRQKASIMPDGRTLPEREVYPPSSAWGSHGWTFYTQERAMQHMAKLCEST